jgi:hypothetical protein
VILGQFEFGVKPNVSTCKKNTKDAITATAQNLDNNLGDKTMVKKIFSVHNISWFICIFLLAVTIAVSVFCSNIVKTVEQKYNEMNVYGQEIAESHSNYIQGLLAMKDSVAEKDAFIFFGQNVIAKYYSTHRETSTYKHMTAAQRNAFLIAIYDCSKAYPLIDLSASEVRLMALSYCKTESEFNGNPNLRSKTDAKGLFQFMDATAQRICKKIDIDWAQQVAYDPTIAVRMWFSYYHEIKSKFITSPYIEEFAAIEYNSGRNNVWASLNLTPDEFIVNGSNETKEYYKKIMRNYEDYKTQFEAQ